MFRLSCPGKIFLAGEYLALKGGASLVLCTEPRFELEVWESTESISQDEEYQGIPEGSPAWRLLKGSGEIGQKFKLRFKDPHQGRGGFGASSAQFLLCYFLLTEFESLRRGLFPQLSVSELIKCYHSYSWSGEGWPPSGADLLAQYKGGLVLNASGRGLLERFSWPFDDLAFLAFPTGQKVATHEHLIQLQDFSTEDLAGIVDRIESALREVDQVGFLGGIVDWQKAMSKAGWVHSSTQAILKSLYDDPRVLAAKGCGALGADVILLFMKSSEVETFMLENRWGPMFKNLSQGIQWKQI